MTDRALHATLLDTLPGGERGISYVSLERAEREGLCPSSRLPFTLRILAESALRHAADPASLDLGGLDRRPRAGIIEFHPARLLLQDFTGVPLMTDLASLRDAVAEKGGDPLRVNPRIPIDFVLDHALIAVHGGRADARALNERIEIERNRERFAFLKWCAQAFDNIRLLPPGAGIMHQLNLEYLSSVVRVEPFENGLLAMPDTVMGTDSHTTMVSGLGVLGLGVGGIEAEGAMLGHPTLLSRPRVVGLRLEGELPPGTIATDLVLHVAERLRKRGVTGAFIEACGSGIDKMPVETRATIANMAPEYGAAGVYFPIDDMTLRYLRLTGRDEALIRRVETYAKCQMLWRYPAVPVDPSIYDEVIEFDLSSVEPSLAGPNRPEQRVSLSGVRGSFERVFGARADQAPAATRGRPFARGWRRRHCRDHELHQHRQPERDARGRPARAQCREAGPQAEALGQDVLCAGLACRARVHAGCGLAGRSRCPGLSDHRLRLHHLQRQLRAAGARSGRRHCRARDSGRRGSLRQPQFRGPHPSAGACGLPRLACSRHRLCAHGNGAVRSHPRSHRRRRERARDHAVGGVAFGCRGGGAVVRGLCRKVPWRLPERAARAFRLAGRPRGRPVRAIPGNPTTRSLPRCRAKS